MNTKPILKSLLLASCLCFPMAFASAQIATQPAADTISGKVVETMNASSYTYVRVEAAGKKVWAASTQFAVKVGDSVSFSASDPMENFHSKTLNRDFDLVYFTGSITVNNGDGATAGSAPALPAGHPALPGVGNSTLPPNHPPIAEQTPAPKLDLGGIKPAAGGKTVQQIMANGTKLAGQTVAVRGKVVKYNAGILGKNWLHIRDGTGSAAMDDNDLTITTTNKAKLGDTVLVIGIISTNKDFGSNYKFSVMLDDAQVTAEQAH